MTAYFDDHGKPINPGLATWAKVWTPDGADMQVRIVSLKGEAR